MKYTLKDIVRYWCDEVSPPHVDRFDHSVEKLGDMIYSDPTSATLAIDAIATCQPTKSRELLGLFAAGKLEDLVSEVVERKDTHRAAMIVYSPVLRPLLKWVWTKECVDNLKKLAIKAKSTYKRPMHKQVEIKASYTINQLMAFWCNEFSSRYIQTFSEGAQYVDYCCRNPKNPKFIEDLEWLILSAPDRRAIIDSVEHLLIGLVVELPRTSRSKMIAKLRESRILNPYVQDKWAKY